MVCVAWFKVRDACECNDSLTLEPPDLDDKYLIFVLRADRRYIMVKYINMVRDPIPPE